MEWSKLSMKDRAAVIRMAVQSGLSNRDDIVNFYNSYKKGGQKEGISDELYYSIMERVAKENWREWGDHTFIPSVDLTIDRAVRGNRFDGKGRSQMRRLTKGSEYRVTLRTDAILGARPLLFNPIKRVLDPQEVHNFNEEEKKIYKLYGAKAALQYRANVAKRNSCVISLDNRTELLRLRAASDAAYREQVVQAAKDINRFEGILEDVTAGLLGGDYVDPEYMADHPRELDRHATRRGGEGLGLVAAGLGVADGIASGVAELGAEATLQLAGEFAGNLAAGMAIDEASNLITGTTVGGNVRRGLQYLGAPEHFDDPVLEVAYLILPEFLNPGYYWMPSYEGIMAIPSVAKQGALDIWQGVKDTPAATAAALKAGYQAGKTKLNTARDVISDAAAAIRFGIRVNSNRYRSISLQSYYDDLINDLSWYTKDPLIGLWNPTGNLELDLAHLGMSLLFLKPDLYQATRRTITRLPISDKLKSKLLSRLETGTLEGKSQLYSDYITNTVNPMAESNKKIKSLKDKFTTGINLSRGYSGLLKYPFRIITTPEGEVINVPSSADEGVPTVDLLNHDVFRFGTPELITKYWQTRFGENPPFDIHPRGDGFGRSSFTYNGGKNFNPTLDFQVPPNSQVLQSVSEYKIPQYGTSNMIHYKLNRATPPMELQYNNGQERIILDGEFFFSHFDDPEAVNSTIELNLNHILLVIPGFKPFGSSVLTKELGYVKSPNDFDGFLLEDDLLKLDSKYFIRGSYGDDLVTFNIGKHDGINYSINGGEGFPYDPNIGDEFNGIDLNILYSKGNGTKPTARSLELWRLFYPEEYLLWHLSIGFGLSADRTINTIDGIPYPDVIPHTPQELIEKIDKRKSVIDMIDINFSKGNKGKHIPRLYDFVINSGNSKSTEELIRSALLKDARQLAPKFEFDNILENIEFLKKIGITNETVANEVALDPHKMQTLADLYYYDNTVHMRGVSHHGESLRTSLTESLSVPELNYGGGNSEGTALDAVLNGDSGFGPYKGLILPYIDLSNMTSPIEMINLIDKAMGRVITPELTLALASAGYPNITSPTDFLFSLLSSNKSSLEWAEATARMGDIAGISAVSRGASYGNSTWSGLTGTPKNWKLPPHIALTSEGRMPFNRRLSKYLESVNPAQLKWRSPSTEPSVKNNKLILENRYAINRANLALKTKLNSKLLDIDKNDLEFLYKPIILGINPRDVAYGMGAGLTGIVGYAIINLIMETNSIRDRLVKDYGYNREEVENMNSTRLKILLREEQNKKENETRKDN